MFLYRIKNTVDGKEYAGITSDIKRRWKEHKSELKNNKHHNKHLQAAWNKYGKEKFVFNIINNNFNNLNELAKAEIEYIESNELFKTNKGYNLAKGGVFSSHTEESRKKISKSNEKSVICKCLKTGKEKVYKKVFDVKKDGFNPKNIAGACNGRSLTYKGFVWLYLNDHILKPQKLNEKFNNFQNTKSRPSKYKKVYGMNIVTNNIKKYDAIDHVKKDGFSSSSVRRCASQKKNCISHKNHVWSYNKEELQKRKDIALSPRPNSKDIYKFDLSGKFIKKVDKNDLTKTEINSIQSVCSGHKETYKGMKYSYKKTLENTVYSKKSFIKMDKNNNILEKYVNINELMNKNDYIKSTAGIYKCCNGKANTAYGFKWSFAGGELSL